MLDPSVTFEWNWCTNHKPGIGSQKYDADTDKDTDDDEDAEGVMIPMCRPCFSGATKTIASVRVILPWRPIKVTLHPQIVHWDPLNPKLSRP